MFPLHTPSPSRGYAPDLPRCPISRARERFLDAGCQPKRRRHGRHAAGPVAHTTARPGLRLERPDSEKRRQLPAPERSCSRLAHFSQHLYRVESSLGSFFVLEVSEHEETPEGAL